MLYVCTAVEYMHSHGIAHRDLSLENLLLTDDGNITVIDLGLAVRLPQHRPSGQFVQLAACGPTGKLTYMPPEVRGG